MAKNYDVIIAGCGPTGATFANYFGKFGLSTLIFDKEENIIDFPRAVHIDEDGIRVFQELGLYEKMKEESIKPFHAYDLVTKNDKLLFTFKPNSSLTEDICASNWISQPELEKTIRNGMMEYPNVEFLPNTIWTDFAQVDEQIIEMHLKQGEEVFCVQARFLIACDGGRSGIRKQLNIGIEDLGFKKEWLVLDLKYRGEKSFSEHHKQFCDPEQPITYVNGVRDHFRWEFMVTDKDKNLSEDDLGNLMVSKLGKKFPVNEFETIRRKRYTFHSVIAQQWKVGNIFLAGDAAHQMPPFLGQGLCSGIKDAKNLSWKISAVCNHPNNTPDKFLDSYFSERYLQVWKIIKFATVLGAAIQSTNKYFVPIRNMILLLLNKLPQKGPDELINSHLYSLNINKSNRNGHRLIGKRMIQPKVLHNNKMTYLDAVFKFDWCFLHGVTEIPDAITECRNIKVLRLTDHPTQQNDIQSEHIKKWMKTNKADFVLIRPDKFIEFAGEQKHLLKESEKISEYLTQILNN